MIQTDARVVLCRILYSHVFFETVALFLPTFVEEGEVSPLGTTTIMSSSMIGGLFSRAGIGWTVSLELKDTLRLSALPPPLAEDTEETFLSDDWLCFLALVVGVAAVGVVTAFLAFAELVDSGPANITGDFTLGEVGEIVGLTVGPIVGAIVGLAGGLMAALSLLLSTGLVGRLNDVDSSQSVLSSAMSVDDSPPTPPRDIVLGASSAPARRVSSTRAPGGVLGVSAGGCGSSVGVAGSFPFALL